VILQTTPAIVYEGSRRRAAISLLIIVGLVFGGWGLSYVEGPNRHSTERYEVLGWGAMVFFGSFIPLATAWLFRPPRLSIDSFGFSIQQPWGTRRYSWADIEEVWAYYHGSNSWVVWTLRNREDQPWWLLTSEYDGRLNGLWDCSTEEVAWEMNAARAPTH
jgi:hypothetical protein